MTKRHPEHDYDESVWPKAARSDKKNSAYIKQLPPDWEDVVINGTAYNFMLHRKTTYRLMLTMRHNIVYYNTITTSINKTVTYTK